MSLDIDLMITKPTSVWDWNITHNLTEMADAVELDEDITLYDILWRPDENGLEFAEDIVTYLEKGLNILISNPEGYKKYNPENGWGSYEGLVKFVREYIVACKENPDAYIRVSR